MEWISVKDEVPSESDVYLIANSDKGVWIGFFMAGKWLDDDAKEVETGNHRVTHWMPLPPAPKE